MKKRIALVASVAAIACMAGWQANDILMGSRMSIFDSAGNARIVAAIDQMDQPYLVMLDRTGKEVARVDGRRKVERTVEPPPPAPSLSESHPFAGKVVSIDYLDPADLILERSEPLNNAIGAVDRWIQNHRGHSRYTDAVKAQERFLARLKSLRDEIATAGAGEYVVIADMGHSTATLRVPESTIEDAGAIIVGAPIRWDGKLTSASDGRVSYRVSRLMAD